MNDTVGSEFKFETKTVQVPGLKNPNVTFRIPVPLGNFDLKLESQNDSTNYIPPDTLFTQNQHSINVRGPFKNIIEKNIEHIQKLFEVRLSLQDVEGDLKLISSGEKSESAINEILDICRKSNVYNFYLCFPVRGDQFHKKFSEFQKLVKNKIGEYLILFLSISGPNVSFEKRPHITLALVNLVTDSDIEQVLRALKVTSLTIQSVPKPKSQDEMDNYSLELEGLGVVKYKGRFSKRSVLYSNVKMTETLSDIASEFQNTLNKSINTLLRNQPKRKKLTKHNRISWLTESQLGPRGIFLTRGGNLEISFTDVPLVDPKSEVKVNEEESEIESFYKETNLESEKETEVEVENKENKVEESETDEEGYEYDTSVKNKFHVTLMRHEQVNSLSNLKFSSKGHVVCVELRPRNGETCNFRAYTANEFVYYVGNRFDNKENEDLSTQAYGHKAPNIPDQYLFDMETGNDDSSERFVFWL